MAQQWVPQHHRDITLARLGTFTSESWGKSNILPVLYHTRGGDISIEVWSPPAGLEHPKFEDVLKQQFRPTKCGESFGPTWATHWFRVHVRVPDDWVSAPAGAPLLFVWDSGSEAMVWLDDGQPHQGLTDERNEYVLATSVRPGDAYVLYVEMSCNGVGGAGDGIQPPPTDRQYTLKVVELAVPDPLAQQLLADFLVVADMAKSLPADSAAGARALYTANAMINTFRREDRGTWEAARQLALKVLQRGASPAHQVTAIGHCHIDTAWLWPFEETHRKVARSWSAQLELLDRYPQHTFAASSAQQYAWLQAEYPGLWTRLQVAVAAGRFVPVGGAWVEMDTNLPSGESLVRQLLYGQRFFESAFGKRCDVFWLPDTFGYAAQLPQLVRGAGMDYFLTQKLSWNNINTFPHNTFMWEALDGTSLLTHFPPSNTYNSQVSVSDLLMSCTNHKDKDRSPSSLLLFGNGDGGGGPTQAMCEALERLADPQGLGVDGVVRCQQGSPSDFFKSVAAQAQDLLSWRGELYFELHRGTYTSHAANKMFNRRCEGLLREVEMLGALAVAHGALGYTYPRQVLDKLWQDTLLFQFHDVLPGSAIGLVYEHTARAYPNMVAALLVLRATASDALLRATQPAPPSPAPRSLPLHAAVGQSGRQESAGLVEGQRLAMGDVMGAQLAPGFLDSLEGLGLSTTPEQGGLIQPVDPRGGQPQRWAEPHVPVGGRWPLDYSHSGGPSAMDAPARAPGPAMDPRMGVTPAGSPRPEHAPLNEPWVFNALSVSRTEVLEVPSHLVPAGVTAQVGAENGPSPGVALVAVSLPPLSLTPVFGQEAGHTGPLVEEEEGATACMMRNANGRMVYQLMNRYVRVVLDSNGRLISMYDKVWHRELVPHGGLGNRFRIYEDVPIFWDAWDVEIYHLEKGADAGMPTSLEIVESGPVRACLAYSCPLSATSRLQQYITLTVSSPRLEFSSTVEWNETHKLLKVEFPWALQADQATYEVQFGAVARPTRPNTSWDWTRFEVVGHRWADLSEPDYGVALLNDCKYGHATHGNTQRLTLLKSPKAPDANTDMGTHNFRYALCPHAHGWQAGGVVAAGLAFNSPPILVPAPSGPAPQLTTAPGWPRGVAGEPLLHVVSVGPRPVADQPGPLILDTLKLAETPVLTPVQPGAPIPSTGPQEAEGVALVARLYEPHGCRGRALLRVGGGLTLLRAAQGNLLEDVLQELPLVPGAARQTHAGVTAVWQGQGREHAAGHAGVGQGAGVVLEFTPFQVLTILLWVQPPAVPAAPHAG